VVQLYFDLWAILHKHENLWATSNRMVWQTTDSQDLKLKRKGERIIEIIVQQQIAIYYKSLSVGYLWLRLL